MAAKFSIALLNSRTHFAAHENQTSDHLIAFRKQNPHCSSLGTCSDLGIYDPYEQS